MRTGTYRSLKNDQMYLVLFEAIHTETGEQMVVYVPRYDTALGIAVRPKSLFMERFRLVCGTDVE